MERLVGDVPYDVMGVVDRQRSGTIERLVDVFLHQVSNTLEVQDGLSPGVEGEATYLAAFLSRTGAVGVIFGSAGHEFVDDVAFQFVLELAQETSSRQVGLALGGQVHHGIRVHVQDAGVQREQPVVIQFDAGVGGGEGGHEDVGVGAQFAHVFFERVVHVDHLFAGRQDAMDVAFAVQEDVEEALGVLAGGHLGLVGALTEFAPETVGHQFAQRASTLVAFDLGRVEDHPFDAPKLFQVLDLQGGIFFHLGRGPAVGFLFHLDPGIDVIPEQGGGGRTKVPQFVDVENHVPLVQGQHQFGRAPGPHEGSFARGVVADVGAFRPG